MYPPTIHEPFIYGAIEVDDCNIYPYAPRLVSHIRSVSSFDWGPGGYTNAEELMERIGWY